VAQKEIAAGGLLVRSGRQAPGLTRFMASLSIGRTAKSEEFFLRHA
jgi:hypothetical protein